MISGFDASRQVSCSMAIAVSKIGEEKRGVKSKRDG